MARYSAIALLAAAYAATASASTINFDSCPDGWSGSTMGDSDKVYCCYGSSVIIDDSGYCCLGSSNNVVGADFSSEFADATGFKRDDIPKPSCAATVDYSDPNYSSKVSSLSKSLDTTSTMGSPASNTASATSTDASSTDGSSSASATNAAATTTSGNAAGAMPTAEILGGVLAVAAAFAM